MVLTIYEQDGSYYDITGVEHILQHSHDCTIGLDIEIMINHGDGNYSMKDMHLEPNVFYSIDVE